MFVYMPKLAFDISLYMQQTSVLDAFSVDVIPYNSLLENLLPNSGSGLRNKNKPLLHRLFLNNDIVFYI